MCVSQNIAGNSFASYPLHFYHTRLTALCPGIRRWAVTRKVKPIWIFLKQETVSGSGISWAECKSASRSRQITMPAPNQQHQSTEGKFIFISLFCITACCYCDCVHFLCPLLFQNRRELTTTYKFWFFFPENVQLKCDICAVWACCLPWQCGRSLVRDENGLKMQVHFCLQLRRKGIRPVKNWVVRCWHGYLSRARCRLAYAQLMPLPLTVSCFSKIQIGFAFLVLAHPGSPGQRAVKRVCVCVLLIMFQACGVNEG